MATEVIMPALGMAQTTGKLIRWLKAAGEPVTKGEPLVEIETDKASVEVEAPASGVLANLSAAAGDEIPVGKAIGLIVELAEQTAAQPPAGAPPPVLASPLAARLAAENQVDLKLVKPAGGRIEKADVLAYLAQRQAQKAASAESPLPQAAGAAPETRPPTVSRAWRVMAERTHQAWTGVPHFYLMRDVDAGRLTAWYQTKTSSATKVTYTDLLIKLAAHALRLHPRVNASWADGAIILHDDINIGVAVALDDGLIVPVVHHADKLRLTEIAARRAAVIQRTRAGGLHPEDLSGGTFTISNLGMYGVDVFNAIINPPQAALLAVGRISDRVTAVNGQPAVRPILTLSLTCDHRVVDGARGAQFLSTLAGVIEEPLALLD